MPDARTFTPARECGLKRISQRTYYDNPMFTPARECGLKLVGNRIHGTVRGFTPARECGLKPLERRGQRIEHYVHSRAGVWIETSPSRWLAVRQRSLPR